ncbi:putative RDD family membrane protein YckC [Streptomonospora nanhaiensis]|uniref:Putative RDD family membrane protein YckC n=1 Tax=Streptomonospora nanhaiensis TaxID=1323731 RepID=A0A853BQ04_9ACTN|nr:putative RDD family membrane protein YckC [Streptomonospora nanhaiensis]
MNHLPQGWNDWNAWNAPPPGPPGFPGPPPHAAPPVAGFGRRLGARLIDYTLLTMFAFMFFIVTVLVNPASLQGGEPQDGFYDAWAYLILFGWGVLLFFYDWLFHIAGGRTIGKMMVRVRVVRADGGRLRQGQAAGRALLFGLPQCLLCLGHVFTLLDCLWCLSDDERRRTLHDRAAGTIVVRD